MRAEHACLPDKARELGHVPPSQVSLKHAVLRLTMCSWCRARGRQDAVRARFHDVTLAYTSC